MDSKKDIRQEIWQAMKNAKVAAFPGTVGRIPNFTGSGIAHRQLIELDVWKNASTVKSNPDLPQRPLRRRALEEGKTVYMAVPRLTSNQCFIELDPLHISNYSFASTIKGSFTLGRAIHPKDMKPIDLIICGSVAVTRLGSRLGKGGGFSDIEHAIALTMGLITKHTPVLTTVHEIQIINSEIPMTSHDVPVDFIGTPGELISCPATYPKPHGILWEQLGSKVYEIPILNDLKAPKQ